MTVPTLQFEAKVRATTRRSNKSGDWWSVTLEVHPQDFTEDLCGMAGRQQQVMVVLAQVNDQGEPEKPRRKPAETRAELARRLCGVKDFQHFIWRKVAHFAKPSPATAENEREYAFCKARLKALCQIQHTAELDTDPEAAKRWDALYSEYLQQAGRMAEKR